MRRLMLLLPLTMSVGCLEEPAYDCTSNDQCLLDGFMGTCDQASSRCVYPSADCRGILSIEGFVDGQGNCVPAPSNIVEPATTGDDDASTGAPEAPPTGSRRR